MAITWTYDRFYIARKPSRNNPEGAEKLITAEELFYLKGGTFDDPTPNGWYNPEGGKPFVIELRPGAFTSAEIGALETHADTLSAADYGTKWRMWLGEPNDAQKATPWP